MSTADDRRFYASARWRRVREAALWRDGGLCVLCKAIGVLTPAVEIDHIQPRSDRPDLELTIDNLQSLCKKHHGLKSASDGSPIVRRCVHGYEVGSGVCCDE